MRSTHRPDNARHSHLGNVSSNANATNNARKRDGGFMKRSRTLPIMFLAVVVLAAGFVVVSGRAALFGVRWPTSISKVFASGKVRYAPARQETGAREMRPLTPLTASDALPILYYDFENNATRTTFENAVEQAVNTGSAAITRAGNTTIVSSVAGAGSFNSGAAAGQAATGNNWSAATADLGAAATDYFQFVVNTTGFSQLSVTFDQQASATGPARVGVLYSTNGVTFTATTTALTGNAAFVASTFDLSSITAIDNQSSVIIRLYAYAGSAGDRTGRSAFSSSGTFRIDNLTVRAATVTASKTLLDYPAIGLSIKSGTAFNPPYGDFTVNGTGITVSLASAIQESGTFTVSNGTLNCGTNAITGSGAFTLGATGVLGLGSTAGLSTTASTGNIQVTGTRTYASGSTFVYNGVASQTVGNGLPVSVSNLTIANSGSPGNDVVTGNLGQIVTTELNIIDGTYLSGSDYNDVVIQPAGTLSLANDITVSGNWTDSGTFTPNGKNVIFDGTGTQTITCAAGTETFYSLGVNKPSGSLVFDSTNSTSVMLTATTGNVLQLLNAGAIDLAGNSLTMQFSGGSVLVAGGVRNIGDPSNLGGSVVFNGSKSIVSTGAGTLSFNDNIEVILQGAVDFGASLTTMNGSSRLVRGMTGSVNTNPPTYGSNSTLVYNLGTLGFVPRGLEWSATSGPGYPSNVEIDTGSYVGLSSNTSNVAKAMAGGLTILTNAELSMAAGQPMSASLTIGGGVDIQGTGVLTMSSAAGGDLLVGGNFRKEATATFTPMGRSVTFNGTGTQNINGVSAAIAFDYLYLNKTSGSVALLTNSSVAAPGGGDSLQFNGGAGDVFNLNGQTFTINSGSIGGSNAAGAFAGSNSSSLVLNGTGAVGTLRFTSGNESLGGLTMNRTSSGSVTLGSALTINGGANALTLTDGIVDTGAFTLTMGGDATSNGSSSSYVVGTMKKIYDAVPKSFTFDLGTIGGTTAGYTPAAVDALVTSATGDVTARVTNAFQPVMDPTKALRRYWTLTNNGLTAANLTFNYLDGDIPGTTNEALWVAFKVDGLTATTPAGSAVVAATNQITVANATSFSDWTAAEPEAPTATRLIGFSATRDHGEVTLRWQSGYEARNLGYNVYREQNGQRVAITPSLVAGSALLAGRRTKLTAGLSYTWIDSNPQAAINSQQPTYWLEDVDLDGTRTLHGPIAIAECGMGNGECKKVGQRSPLLGELTNQRSAISTQQSNNGVLMNSWPAAVTHPDKLEEEPDPTEMQRTIAGLPALKLSISHTGWYRLTQPEVLAAGLNIADANGLQLYRDGRQVAFRLSNNSEQFGPADYLEFYGEGISSPTTSAQTYYLVKLTEPGKRIEVKTRSVGPGDRVSPQGFAYTVERKERMIYFAGLLNGDAENFFGQVVSSSSATSATIPSRHPDTSTTNASQLEVVLQGVSSQNHMVRVRFNGAELGTMNYANSEHPSQTFSVPAALLQDGNNTIELTALDGPADISLVDALRLTYVRAFVADNNELGFNLDSRQTKRLTGFTNPNLRVIDVTDAYNPSELVPDVAAADGGGYSALIGVDREVRAPFSRPHELLAFTDGQTQSPDAVSLNVPSALWSETAGADYLLLTTSALKTNVEPLAQLRRNQGLVVKVVDVEDLYDEFSFGVHTPRAIHDFLERATTTWTRRPHYVLLAGDASYDPKNYLGQGCNDLVPTRLIDAALAETASDDWLADFNDDGIADLSMGRLPVRTAAETDALVGKILHYEAMAPDASREGLLVADNGFESRSTAIGTLLPPGMTVATINRSSADDATIHNQIIAGLNQGPRVANYFGHGSNGVWTGASLLSSDDAPSLTNTNRLTVFSMMTCYNGYFQDAYNDSLSEALLKSPGGAVAVWASTTLTEPSGQNAIDQEFYRQLFGGSSPTLGDAVRAAKQTTSDADVRRTWTLFGDPAMRLH